MRLDDNTRAAIMTALLAWIKVLMILNVFSLDDAALLALTVALDTTVLLVFRIWKKGEGGEGDTPPPTPEREAKTQG